MSSVWQFMHPDDVLQLARERQLEFIRMSAISAQVPRQQAPGLGQVLRLARHVVASMTLKGSA